MLSGVNLRPGFRDMTPISFENDGGAGGRPKQYHDKHDVAAEFGITTRTLEQWMKRGLIPFFKIGKTVRFDLHSVRAHLEANCLVGGRR